MIIRRKSNFLCHHGIKNQHWGVRNGPPYPLDSKVSRAIKRGKNENRNEGKKVGVTHTAAAAGTYYTRSISEVNSMPWSEFYKQPESYKRQFRDTDLGLKEVNQFYFNDGSWKYRNPLEMDDVNTLLSSNFKEGKNSVLCISDFEKKRIRENGFYNDDHSIALLKSINATEFNSRETQNNCSKCSDMVELLCRGINPKTFSAGRSKFGMLSSATQYHWDGAVAYKEKSYENIERRIKSFGNHGSGTIGIRRADGSGHSMHFTNVKGRIEVQDGQNYRVYRTLTDALKAEGHDPNQFCHITRLDQATPNIKHMLEDSVIRMDRRFNDSGGVEYKNGRAWINDRNSMSSLTNSRGDIDTDKRDAYRDRSTGRTYRYNG